MAAELLQALSTLKTSNDQNTLTQAINQDRRTLDQHAGLINQHAQVLTSQATQVQTLRAEVGANAGVQNIQFGIQLAILLAIGVTVILWVNHLQGRIKKLEAINPPRGS